MPPQQGRSGPSFADAPTGVKAMLLVVEAGLCAAVLYLAVYRPLQQDIVGAIHRYNNLQQELGKAQQRQQRYIQLQQQLAQRQPLDERNKRALPEHAEIASFLQDINRLAELSGLDIRLVEPQPEQAEQFYVRIPVALQLRGSYHNLMKFFYNVSRLERVVNMENVSMGNPRLQDDRVVLDVSVEATTFRRAESAQAAAGAAARDNPGRAGQPAQAARR